MNTPLSRHSLFAVLLSWQVVLCLGTLAGRAADGYDFRPPQRFNILARHGQAGLVQVTPEVSVNAQGLVVFVGLADGGSGGAPRMCLFYANAAASGNPAPLWAPTLFGELRELGPEVSVNNSAQILTRRAIEDFIPLFGAMWTSHLDLWNGMNGVRATLVSGAPAPVSWEFNIIHSECALNNNADWAGFGRAGGTDCLLMSSAGVRTSANLGVVFPSVRLSDRVDPRLLWWLSDRTTRRGLLVFRYDNKIMALPMGTLSPFEVASDWNGFSAVGEHPAISDDGTIVLFTGVLSNPRNSAAALKPGPGVFARLLRESSAASRLVRLAGIHANGYSDPGEFWDDNADGQRDAEFTDRRDADIGLISAIDHDGAVCVNKLGYAAFTALDVNGRKCVWFTRVNRAYEHCEAADPFVVLGVGDVIDGLAGTVSDVVLSDSLGDRGVPGDLVIWVKMSTGDEAIVAAEPRPRPVIFIPGIAGSKLERPNDQLWPTLKPGDLRDLTLNPAGVLSDIRPTDVVRTYPETVGSDIYRQLLEVLPERGGYREVLPVTQPQPAGEYTLPPNSVETNPTLFVFPYDWRLSNTDSAKRLRQYILAIRDLYPDTEVDLVCHSMGGLVAGRYFLNFPNGHYVKRCVTIGSPLLGAVVAYKRVLEGDFYGVLFGAADWVNNEAITEVLPWFPGFHELLPSPVYFPLQAGSVFVERGWDLNGNRNNNEDWSPSDIRGFFDARYPAVGQRPVARNETFHVRDQDDWSGWSTGVDYLHFAGVQSRRSTTVQLQARVAVHFSAIPPHRATVETYLYEAKGWGDYTVPFVSAFRTPGMLAPGGQRTVVQADGTYRAFTHFDYLDSKSEHSGLTQNPRVHRGLLYFLRTGQRLWTDPTPATAASTPGLAGPGPAIERELLVVGTKQVQIKAPDGSSTQTIEDSLFIPPEGVTYSSGRNSAQVQYPAEGTFEFTFVSRDAPLTLGLIELTRRDRDGTTLRAVRFHAVMLKPGATARLVDTGAPPYVLLIDEGSDGSVDTTLAAPFVAEGTLASDDRPPVVSFNRVCRDGKALVALAADDALAGVESTVYQVGETPPEAYTKEIEALTLTGGILRAFATDLAGNRSPLYEFPVLPRLAARQVSDRVRLTWEKTCWRLVLESSLDLGTAWKPIDAPVSEFEGMSGVEVPGNEGECFFRLRLAP